MALSYRRKVSCDIAALIEKSFFLQRKEILDGATAEQMEKQWPLLFTPLGFSTNFHLLTGVDISAMMSSAELEGKIQRIIAFFSEKGGSAVKAALLTRVIPAETRAGRPKTALASALLLLCRHFKEDISFVLVEKDVRMCFTLFCEITIFSQTSGDFRQPRRLQTSRASLNNLLR